MTFYGDNGTKIVFYYGFKLFLPLDMHTIDLHYGEIDQSDRHI